MTDSVDPLSEPLRPITDAFLGDWWTEQQPGAEEDASTPYVDPWSALEDIPFLDTSMVAGADLVERVDALKKTALRWIVNAVIVLGIGAALWFLGHSQGAKHLAFDAFKWSAETFSPYGTAIGFAIIVGVIGAILYAFRSVEVAGYGAVEVFVGGYIAWYVSFHLDYQNFDLFSEKLERDLFAVSTGLYVIVRGLDNIYKGIQDNTKIMKKWNYVFFFKKNASLRIKQ